MLKPRVNFLLFMLLAMVSCIAGDVSQGWDYKYEVELPGKRSETVTNGRLLYKGVELPKEYEHVITPIGEFVFIDSRRLHAIKKAGWMPFGKMPGYSVGSMNPAFDEADVKALLDGNPRQSLTTNIKTEPYTVPTDESNPGTLDKPFAEVGTDWLFVVKEYLWVNPKYVGEVIKGIVDRRKNIDTLPYALPLMGKAGYVIDPFAHGPCAYVGSLPTGTAIQSPYIGKWFRVPAPAQ